MDPEACLDELLSEMTVDDPDLDQIAEHLRNLANWITNGGFLPTLPNIIDSEVCR